MKKDKKEAKKEVKKDHADKPKKLHAAPVVDYKQKWLYLSAEFENYKKRVLKEQQNIFKYGNDNFAREMIAVIDNLNRSLAHVKNEDSGLVKGIQLTLKQFLVVFEKFGIKPVESVGKHFDPNFHEALAELDSEKPAGTILEEHSKGYLLHDRLLRSAKVVVAKKKEEKKGGQDGKK